LGAVAPADAGGQINIAGFAFTGSQSIGLVAGFVFIGFLMLYRRRQQKQKEQVRAILAHYMALEDANMSTDWLEDGHGRYTQHGI
jgi:hypothetical protein